jgi:hypothetical protein
VTNHLTAKEVKMGALVIVTKIDERTVIETEIEVGTGREIKSENGIMNDEKAGIEIAQEIEIERRPLSDGIEVLKDPEAGIEVGIVIGEEVVTAVVIGEEVVTAVVIGEEVVTAVVIVVMAEEGNAVVTKTGSAAGIEDEIGVVIVVVMVTEAESDILDEVLLDQVYPHPRLPRDHPQEIVIANHLLNTSAHILQRDTPLLLLLPLLSLLFPLCHNFHSHKNMDETMTSIRS